MPHWPGAPQVDVHVRYNSRNIESSNSGDTPTFTGGDRISGSAIFTLKKNYEGLRYKVVVKGNVQAKIVENCHGTLQSHATYETHTFFTASAFDGTKSVTPTGSKFQAEVPFSFVLQKPNGQSSLDLLPSVDSKYSKGRWLDTIKSDTNVEYQITYTVIASALQDEKIIASTPSRFHYIPATPEPDSILPEDFPGEYMVRTSKDLRNGSSSNRLGVISPECVNLPMQATDSTLTTDLQLTLMLVRRHNNSRKPAQSPTKYDVAANLKTTTFIMPQRSRRELHTLYAAPHSNAVIKQSRSNAQRHIATFQQWDAHDSESDGDEKGPYFEEVVTNTITIPFSINVDQALTPDFWSLLLSRRHTIELNITLDDDSSLTTKLRIPLQIYLQAVECV